MNLVRNLNFIFSTRRAAKALYSRKTNTTANYNYYILILFTRYHIHIRIQWEKDDLSLWLSRMVLKIKITEKAKIYLNNVFLFLRSRVEGVITFINGLASALGSLVMITRQYFEPLTMILRGTFPIVASLCVYFLPETLNLPLPDTTEDVERR